MASDERNHVIKFFLISPLYFPNEQKFHLATRLARISQPGAGTRTGGRPDACLEEPVDAGGDLVLLAAVGTTLQPGKDKS